MEMLFGKTISLLSQVLDYHARRHETIVSNIANVDTPGYRAKDVVFEKELALRMGERGATADSLYENRIVARVMETKDPVNIDREMSRLAENTIKYNLGIELISRKLKTLKELAREVR